MLGGLGSTLDTMSSRDPRPHAEVMAYVVDTDNGFRRLSNRGSRFFLPAAIAATPCLKDFVAPSRFMVHVSVNAFIYTYMYTYAYTRIYIYIYTHIHV